MNKLTKDMWGAIKWLASGIKKQKQINVNTLLLVAVSIGVQEKLKQIGLDHNSTLALIQWQTDHQRTTDTALKQLDDVRMGQDQMKQDIYNVKNDVRSFSRQFSAITNRLERVEKKVGL